MIDRQTLLSDLKRVLRQLEADLRQRCDELPKVAAALRAEYDAAKEAERTAENFEDWRAGYITQVAAAWVLSCVFVRFLEDNQLVDPPRISGPGERLRRARDEYDLYVRQYPAHTYREYLLSVFDRTSELPGGREIFGKHNPIHQQRGWLSGDAARGLLDFFQRIEPATGNLVHDFGDGNWDTRFLGDLYQDLSEEARDKYALLQTPEFVEEFILDRTLDPAVEEFGIDGFRMIDPACGSGHFLLGSFHRLFLRWSHKEPGTNPRVLAQRALDSVHGVDVNPYAAAIARFRLLLAALRSCRVTRLADAPAFRINVVCGDSLLHGASNDQLVMGFDPLAHAYQSEDLAELRRILKPGSYHAVVANPPYITPKDRALNQAYRVRYSACHGKYSLSVPFLQRIFALAADGGYTGQITANSFMKREFGKKLIEQFLPSVDLTHVIDTGGAYIPGHGTPTVILFGRNRLPVGKSVRAVLGINGEPGTPSDPAHGCVWSAILAQVDHPGSQSKFVSVTNTEREKFHHHPWSIGGGGAAELKDLIETCRTTTVGEVADSIGFMAITGEDELFVAPSRTWKSEYAPHRCFGVGDAIRDWCVDTAHSVVFMYANAPTIDVLPLADLGRLSRFFWPFRVDLKNRLMFGKLPEESGLTWYEYRFFAKERYKSQRLIAFGEVATHNHFVLDRGGKVFKQTAPVIKLPPEATEEDHLGLLGLLNSSTACFWLKQVCHNKGSTVDQNNARQRTAAFEDFYAFNSTSVGKFPVVADRPVKLAQHLEDQARLFAESAPGNHGALKARTFRDWSAVDGESCWRERLGTLISLQEELDWEVYRLYKLIADDLTYAHTPPGVQLGQRAFEIVMARKMAAGELETTWFERHGSTPITDIPADWPEDYRKLVQRRIEVIETNRNIALIEQPEYKRRWNTEPWDQQLERALKSWLLDRLESYFDFDGRMNDEGKPTAKIDISCISVARLADIAGRDTDFMRVGELYRGRPDFDVTRLVAELVEDESVPFLPVLRYKPAAMEKRRAWERTWELQRQEDARSVVSCQLSVATDNGPRTMDIPVPPEYKSTDFQKTSYWRLRGKLDVPKERWVSFPHCEGEDQSAVVAWAGYDHLQLAQAVGTYYAEIKEKGGTKDPRLVPLLAGILELVPWLQQWHNDLDPTYNLRMGDYYAGFVEGEAKELEMTVQQIRDWEPPRQTGRRRRR